MTTEREVISKQTSSSYRPIRLTKTSSIVEIMYTLWLIRQDVRMGRMSHKVSILTS